MDEQAPKSPERQAAERRYRSSAFGPGPEGQVPRPMPKTKGFQSSGKRYGGTYGPGASARRIPSPERASPGEPQKSQRV